MKNILNNNIHYLVFFTFFSLQIYVYQDYGFSWDEPFSRLNGIVSFNYIIEKLSLNNDYSYNNIPELKNYVDNEYGVFFELLNIFFEKILNLKEKNDIFYTRHLFNSFIFFLASIYFYFTLNKFYSKTVSLLGFIIFLAHPRIFSQSFYNSKDIIFLSFFLISNYYLISFFIENKIKYLIFLSFFVAITISTRVMGLLIPFFFIFFLIMENLEQKKYKKIYLLLPFILLTFFFTVLFWPFLWENPLNIILAFKNMSNYDWTGSVFFESKYYSGKFLPWYYLPKIIIITTPLLYVILFFTGMYFGLTRLVKNLININNNKKNIWDNYEQFFLFYSITIIFITIVTVIELKSTLYGGWRQVYFIYPSIIFVTIYGLDKILNLIKFKKVFLILTLISILDVLFWNYKNHPYQYVFYNSLINKKNLKNFELDYWGVSNLDILKKISVVNKTNKSKIFVVSESPYHYSLNLIKEEDHKNFDFVDDIMKAEFILTNHYYQSKNPIAMEKVLNSNFRLIYEIKSNNVRINSIYKKK